MGQLNVKIEEQRLDALRRYAAGRRTPVAWLIKDYIDYLLAGGRPISSVTDQPPSSEELAHLVMEGGAFDWLRDEPDLYKPDDGEPV